MRVVIQRVRHCTITINNKDIRQIGTGLLILLGIEPRDTAGDVDWLVRKILQMRIFEDKSGKMNRSLLDISGSLMLVSQFTLMASTKKGNRPSFIQAAKPELAIPLYRYMIEKLSNQLADKLKTGVFGAHMVLDICNDGPVTICIDSHRRE